MIKVLRKISSLLLLLVFIPATLGFALIHHHCGTCNSRATETAFLFIDQNHRHESDACFCDSQQSAPSCPSQEQAECSCDSEVPEHEYDCELQLKKLESPFPPPSYKDGLPLPTELDFSLIYLAQQLFWPEQDKTFHPKNTYQSPPPPGGFELLQKIALYRL